MWKILKARWAQGFQTSAYPAEVPALPARFRGLPVVDPARCGDGCAACADACPAQALDVREGGVALDLGRCVFCGDCEAGCPAGAVTFTPEHRLAARSRDALVVTGEEGPRVAALDAAARRLFGRSLKLRQVSAGGCNGCEAELVALGNVVFDLGRFGVQFVASPRHADGLVVTGPVTENMKLALEKTWAAVPPPKIVIAVGACAISGGVFRGGDAAHDGAASVVPVDLYVPGCPPHPLTLLDGLLRLLGRLEDAATGRRRGAG